MNSFYAFLDKPAGISSHKCIREFQKSLPFKCKIGHHGTLDPFATGLLLVGVNEATKFFRFLDDSQKTYEATIKLGQTTDTLDTEGEIVQEMPVPDLSPEQIDEALQSFLGKSEQVPPMYSAVKVGGKKLYELARKGEVVERKAREIVIPDLIRDPGRDLTKETLSIKVTCSRGTYIRVLAEDIAKKLGTVGHLIQLRRTKVCGVDANDDDFKASSPVAIESLLKHWPQIEVSEEQKRDLYFGKVIATDTNDGVHALNYQGQFFGMGHVESQNLRSIRLFTA